MSTISAKSISVKYEKETIISDLDFSINSGKITTIIGANGCGKSTLLKSLTRILPLSEGHIYIDGQSIATIPTREIAKTLALLPQVQDHGEGISVFELISYGRYPHQKGLGRLSQKDLEMIEWAMAVTKTTELSDAIVDQLSGGQRQRVWIAMALAQDTQTLFLDEPTTYLDLNHQLEIMQLLQKLNQKEGKTIVMVLHDLNLSARFSDYLVAMQDGQISYQGSVENVMTEKVLADIFKIKATIAPDPQTGCPLLLSYQLL